MTYDDSLLDKAHRAKASAILSDHKKQARKGVRCDACEAVIPLVEMGEHELLCPAEQLHPFDTIRRSEPLATQGRTGKKRSGQTEHRP